MAWLTFACGMARAQTPEFMRGDCEQPDIADVRPRLTCGTVRVPRDNAHPEKGSYDLAVVVIRSADAHRFEDPVLHLSGGPGSPLTRFAGPQARRPFAPGRDTILIDQR